jgi:hypothetical protein
MCAALKDLAAAVAILAVVGAVALTLFGIGYQVPQ